LDRLSGHEEQYWWLDVAHLAEDSDILALFRLAQSLSTVEALSAIARQLFVFRFFS
jgi:hypothetical protein